jgi:uroporphyrinogen decarboxylase
VLFGNIDPVGTMLYGSVDKVRSETASLLDAMAPFENFMMSTACDLPAETPVANIRAMCNVTREWRT